MTDQDERLERVKASLRGTLAGDSLGLVFEGLPPRKTQAMLKNGELRQRFFMGIGVPSDDTAHAYLTALALVGANDDPVRFELLLKRGIRMWFHALPFGIGLATLKSGIKMTLGAKNTAVNSAGNGPAMRAPVIGAWFKDDPDSMAEFVRRSTVLTHSHPLALTGSQIVAELAAGLTPSIPPSWPLDKGNLSKGPSGFIVHTVNSVLDVLPAAQGDTLRAIRLAIENGGDTDTIAAILGGIMGLPNTPTEAERLVGWPNWSDVENFPGKPSYLRILAYHLACYPVVLGHGFRRLIGL